MARKILSRFADTVGDGSGTKSATGNYSSAATEFRIVCQPDEHIFVERMIVSVVGATLPADTYAAIGSALTNGIEVWVEDASGDIEYYLTDEDFPIKTNGEWAHYCHDLDLHAGFAAGDDHMTIRWTFAKSGQPVELLANWSLVVGLNDNFSTGVTEQLFLMQGNFQSPTIGDE